MSRITTHPCDECPSIEGCRISGLECQAFRNHVVEGWWLKWTRERKMLPPSCEDCPNKRWNCEMGCKIMIRGRHNTVKRKFKKKVVLCGVA